MNNQTNIKKLVHDHLSEVLHAAVKEYAARVENGADIPEIDSKQLTATEAVVVWFRRPVTQRQEVPSV